MSDTFCSVTESGGLLPFECQIPSVHEILLKRLVDTYRVLGASGAIMPTDVCLTV